MGRGECYCRFNNWKVLLTGADHQSEKTGLSFCTAFFIIPGIGPLVAAGPIRRDRVRARRRSARRRDRGGLRRPRRSQEQHFAASVGPPVWATRFVCPSNVDMRIGKACPLRRAATVIRPARDVRAPCGPLRLYCRPIDRVNPRFHDEKQRWLPRSNASRARCCHRAQSCIHCLQKCRFAGDVITLGNNSHRRECNGYTACGFPHQELERQIECAKRKGVHERSAGLRVTKNKQGRRSKREANRCS